MSKSPSLAQASAAQTVRFPLPTRLLSAPRFRPPSCPTRPAADTPLVVHYYLHGRNGDFCLQAPLVLGHEAAGVVTAVGPGVRGLVVGQRVAIEAGVMCNSCDYCSRGRYNLCKNMRFASSAKTFPHLDGTLQERMNHPAHVVHPYATIILLLCNADPLTGFPTMLPLTKRHLLNHSLFSSTLSVVPVFTPLPPPPPRQKHRRLLCPTSHQHSLSPTHHHTHPSSFSVLARSVFSPAHWPSRTVPRASVQSTSTKRVWRSHANKASRTTFSAYLRPRQRTRNATPKTRTPCGACAIT